MRPFLVLLCALPICAQQLTITAVNAANFYPTVAPGSILQVQILRGGPVPIDTDLSRYSVTVSGQSAPVIGKATGTFYVQVPQDAPIGDALVILTQDGQTSIPTSITVAATAPGLFSAVQNGGPELNQLTHAAVPGGYLTLWGTGLNGITPTVEIGGIPIRPSYAGAIPGYPGLDQINVQIPGDTALGCYVAVRVTTAGAASNFIPASIGHASASCEHPFGLSLAELQRLDKGQFVRFGVATLRSNAAPSGNFYTRNQSVSVDMPNSGASLLALLGLERPDGCEYAPQLFSTQLNFLELSDAGPFLTLATFLTAFQVPAETRFGFYEYSFPESDPKPTRAELPPPVFTPGAWTLSAPGGATFTAFQTTQTVPPPIRWTNVPVIDRTQDQPIAWQPDGYTDADQMTVTIGAATCRAPAAAGNLVIPAGLLGRLSRSPIATLRMRLAPRPTHRRLFDLPSVIGPTGHAFFDYSFTETQRVEIR